MRKEPMPHVTGIRDMKRRQFPMAYARKPGPLIGCAVQGSPSFGLSRRPERTGCRTFLDKRKAGCPWHPARVAASEEAQGRRSAKTRFRPGSPVSFLQRKAYRFLKKSMVLLYRFAAKRIRRSDRSRPHRRRQRLAGAYPHQAASDFSNHRHLYHPLRRQRHEDL